MQIGQVGIVAGVVELFVVSDDIFFVIRVDSVVAGVGLVSSEDVFSDILIFDVVTCGLFVCLWFE
jgi:hypothetical protein|tara:strand:- start:163 stop:357 length:195 start_codon:yes stop_codon:yes gene_type:complete